MRVLVDEGQAKSPTTIFQPEATRDLLEWGGEVRTTRPPGSATCSMHCKMMILDDCVLACGSANFTDNSLRNNFECTLVTRSSAAVAKAKRSWDGMWQMSRQLDPSMLEAASTVQERRRHRRNKLRAEDAAASSNAPASKTPDRVHIGDD